MPRLRTEDGIMIMIMMEWDGMAPLMALKQGRHSRTPKYTAGDQVSSSSSSSSWIEPNFCGNVANEVNAAKNAKLVVCGARFKLAVCFISELFYKH